MKQILILVVTLMVSMTTFAKGKSIEERAKSYAQEVTMEFKLNDSESQQVYQIRLEQMQKVKTLRKELKEEKEKRKEETKLVRKEAQKKMVKAFGKEKAQQIRKWEKEKTAKAKAAKK